MWIRSGRSWGALICRSCLVRRTLSGSQGSTGPRRLASLDRAISFRERSDRRAAASDLGGVLAASLRRKPREVNPRLDFQLCEHLAQMCVDRVRRHKEALGDLAIGEAVGYELSDGE